MKFYDLSLPLSESTVSWPGDTAFSRQENRGSAITSKLILSSHSGTHMDAPKHFLFEKPGIDAIPLSKLVGRARVIPIRSSPLITLADVKSLKLKRNDKLLFKTRNAHLMRQKTFSADYVSLSLESAKYLAGKKVSLVGIDYFGIEAKSTPGHPVHKTLLSASIVIVEGLDLAKVPTGTYNLAALPLRITGGDGSPARVVLWK